MDFYSRRGATEHCKYRELAFEDWCNEEGLIVTFRQWPKNTMMAFEDSRHEYASGVDGDFGLDTVFIIAKAPHAGFQRAVETGGLVRITRQKMTCAVDEGYLEWAEAVFNVWVKGKEGRMDEEHSDAYAEIYGYDGPIY